MKKIFLILFSFSALSVSAQINLPKPDLKNEAANVMSQFIAPPAIGDIGKTASGITGSLMSQLSLPAAKQGELETSVTSFLKEKNSIMGLAKSNPTDYMKKFSPMQKGLFGKFKTIMGAAAFSKFMGLKPSPKNISGNVLSNLFF